ncbi:hypothetical protein VNO78_34175 [Psophocarpus tetragonolobus]|uniref:Uncharacterized protein n=1 Tax=Psophocarpus tetragonolobus TaxID=3891 RepID=A0AAN9P0L2_PSOTE
MRISGDRTLESHYPPSHHRIKSLSSTASGSLTDLGSHTIQLGLLGSSFQEPLPLYQLGGNIGSSEASPPSPNANGGRLAKP